MKTVRDWVFTKDEDGHSGVIYVALDMLSFAALVLYMVLKNPFGI